MSQFLASKRTFRFSATSQRQSAVGTKPWADGECEAEMSSPPPGGIVESIPLSKRGAEPGGLSSLVPNGCDGRAELLMVSGSWSQCVWTGGQTGATRTNETFPPQSRRTLNLKALLLFLFPLAWSVNSSIYIYILKVGKLASGQHNAS